MHIPPLNFVVSHWSMGKYCILIFLFYEAISIIAKRSGQINSEIKKELHDKLDEFATHNDSLEEIFENKEQIEVSRFYEKLPKPYAIAVQEWLDNKIYFRDSDSEAEQ